MSKGRLPLDHQGRRRVQDVLLCSDKALFWRVAAGRSTDARHWTKVPQSDRRRILEIGLQAASMWPAPTKPS